MKSRSLVSAVQRGQRFVPGGQSRRVKNPRRKSLLRLETLEDRTLLTGPAFLVHDATTGTDFVATQIGLDQLLDGDTIAYTDKVFSSFSYSKTVDMPAASGITVEALSVGPEVGLRFLGDFKDLPGGPASDALIQYVVTSLGALIVGASLASDVTVTGGSGFISITETWLPINTSDLITNFATSSGGVMYSHVDFDLPGYTGFAVQKDIIAASFGDPAGTPSMTHVDQTYLQEEPPLASICGYVYYDSNNDGDRTAETGIGGATVTLTGTDYLGNPVSTTTTTSSDGSYCFTSLLPGTYKLTETQPAGFLDGIDTIGTPGGTTTNDMFSSIVLNAGDNGVENNFGELLPASLCGYVYHDSNNDGNRTGESGIAGATVTLTGTDDLGNSVSQSTTTASDGSYCFTDLRPGTYILAETQPGGFLDGIDTIGTPGGTTTNDMFSNIVLTSGTNGTENNFGEIIDFGPPVGEGNTATIGFWQNKNGQKVIKSLNGGATATALATWLATTFPKLYGPGGMHDLTGKNNTDVANLFVQLFNHKGQKLEAQILGLALAVYVTNSSLNDTSTGQACAQKYGFQITAGGVGGATWNIGSHGSTFGVPDNTTLTVMQILTITNDSVTSNGLFNGVVSDQNAANEVFTAINEAGDII